jgi:hypothetical protein
MKNIQVIDSAQNCSFSIYSVAEEDFRLIFPQVGQDVEFIEDLVKRVGSRRAGEIIKRATTTRLDKADIDGLHGTLFFGMASRRAWYPNKRESDLDKPDLANLLQNEQSPRRRQRSDAPKTRARRRGVSS